MKFNSLAAGLVLGLAGTAAFAQATHTDWYIAPTAGIVLNDSHRNKSTGGAAGLAIGKVLNDKWNVELGGAPAAAIKVSLRGTALRSTP